MTRKVHNHDIKSVYRNDVQRQEWSCGIGYICYIRRCQAGVCSAHMLFYIFQSAMLEDTFREESRQNADLFTVAHVQSKDKNTNILIRELHVADDSALIAHSAVEIPMIVDAFATASSKFDLNININKIEVMLQLNSTTARKDDINVDDTTLNPMQEFTYLDSIIARDDHIEAELRKIMSNASISLGRIRERVWTNHNVSIRVKWKIYQTIIISTLVYGAETWTWTVYRSHI